jgi:hypothetical protein
LEKRKNVGFYHCQPFTCKHQHWNWNHISETWSDELPYILLETLLKVMTEL